MNTFASASVRLAAIVHLAKQMSARGGVGHTGIMKMIYLLQETKGFPLGYDFRLYTYGPYDAQVLEDLKVAQLRHAVASKAVDYQFGRGYQIAAGEAAEEVITKGELPSDLRRAIDQIVADFGARSAADLEIIGTIIFADRAAARGKEKTTPEDLAGRVHDIKPYIADQRILSEAQALKSKGLLESVP
ncbi:MAG: hypothetical protein M0002_02770 [Rhodospirillales bacterium]|nr:hypothetical protein [Rhodospirillales bacterium]